MYTPCHALFKFMITFVINGCYVYVSIYNTSKYLYIPKYRNTAFSQHAMLLVCMFSGVTFSYRITNWCALSWGKLFFLLSASLSCLGFFV